MVLFQTRPKLSILFWGIFVLNVLSIDASDDCTAVNSVTLTNVPGKDILEFCEKYADQVLCTIQNDKRGIWTLKIAAAHEEIGLETGLTAPGNYCDPNPCHNNGKCILSDDMKNYECSCPHPMVGRLCKQLDCGVKHCRQVNDTVIYIYRDTPTEWSVAKAACEKENSTLLMIKDEMTNTLVREHMKDMYKHDPTSKHCYFIGLSRETDSAEFTWVDGSPLGRFRPWAKGPLNGRCVCLPNTEKFDFYWDIDNCKAEDYGWKYFYICSKKIGI